MGISVGGKDEYAVEMNVIPLVDIMLVLLILFIITIPVMTHSVTMDLPRNLDTPPPPPSETVDIEVSFDGSVLWNGQQVTQSDLNSYIANEAIREPQPEVRVRVDRRAQYRYVAGVLFSLQRGGIKKMGVVADARGF